MGVVSVHGDDNELVTPKTYQEALNGELRDLWLEEITNELNSINSYDTWKIHYDDVPPENILTTKWVLQSRKIAMENDHETHFEYQFDEFQNPPQLQKPIRT
jgi:hypothetical protein